MIDFKNIINASRPFYRGLPLIIFTIILATAVAKKYLQYTTPMYESVAYIKLADALVGIPHSYLYRDFDVFASSNNIGAEVETLKSEVVLKKALAILQMNVTVYRIGDLHSTMLYNDCPFIIIPAAIDANDYDVNFKMGITNNVDIEITTSSNQKIKGKINTLIQTPKSSFYIVRNDSLLKNKPGLLLNDNYEFTINSENKLMNELSANLDVMASDKQVPILRIAYKSPVAQKAADVVNVVSKAYIEDYIDEKYANADTTVDFLNRELGEESKKLSASEDAVESFKENNNIVNVKQETETNLRQLEELENHLSGLQMDLVSIDSLNNYIKNGKDHFPDLAPNFQTFNDLLSTELIKKIKSLQSDKHDLLLKYTPENDRVKVVDSKLNDLFSYMQESINNTRQNLQLKYDDLNKTVEERKTALTSFPYKDRNMTVLERNFNLNDETYRFLSEKKTDAEIARSAHGSFHRIISPGIVPKSPVSPNTGFIKVFAGFLGFIGSILLIYLVHFIKGRVNNETNIQKNSDTVLFGKIPYLKNKLLSVKAFQKIAVDLQVKRWLENGSIITISSFGNHEGKRTTAVGLAEAATSLGKKVLVVDVDETINSYANKSFDIIALPQTNSEWNHPEKLKALSETWKKNYDAIIIKNLPIHIQPTALLLMADVTVNVMMLDTRVTKMKRIEDTDLLKIEMGLSNIVFMLNRDGYTPNLFKEIKRNITTIFSKSKSIKTKF